MERKFDEICRKNGPCWHLYTPGKESDNIYRDRDDFILGMNLTAYFAGKYPEVTLYTFQLMNNHHHYLISGQSNIVREFFDAYQSRLAKILNNHKGYDVYPSGYSFKKIDDLNQFRLNVAYINRNGYVVNKEYTPFTYPWGANMFFFNIPISPDGMYSDLPYRVKRAMFHSHDIDCPSHYFMQGDYISPLSYCHVKEAESLFYNAHDYFSSITKGVEAYKEVAQLIGDTLFLSDNEMYSVLRKISHDKYGTFALTKLDSEAKYELAKCMHFDYHASNNQISRILKMDSYDVNSMFPLSSK
jgi:hypothetical protein